MKKKNSLTLIFTVLTSLIFLVVIFSSIYLGYNVGQNPEAERRIPMYLDSRPFLAKVFDVQKNEWGQYQARELSYPFEIADVYFMRFCAHLGLPNFFSITHYFSIIIIAALSVIISIKFFRQKIIIIPVLLAVIFLTSPPSFLTVYYVKSSKELLAVMLTILIGLLLKLFTEKKYDKKTYSLIFLSSLVATLFDRQGFFMIGAWSAIFLIIYFFSKFKPHLKLSLIFLLASVINIIYDLIIGPILIKTIVGYWPIFYYQTLDYKTFLSNPKNLINGWIFFLDTFGILFGNIGRYLSIAAVIILFLLTYLSFRNRLAKNLKNSFLIITVITLSIVAFIVLNGLMIFRHPPLLWPDVERGYYTIPVYVFIIIVANFVAAECQKIWPASSWLIIVSLLVISILNIAATPSHISIIRNGDARISYQISPLILDCVKKKNIPIEDFYLPWKENEALCKALRD